jgi:hypothetical protein
MRLSELKTLCERKLTFHYAEDAIGPRAMLELIRIIEFQRDALERVAEAQGTTFTEPGVIKLRSWAREALRAARRLLSD